MQPTSVCCSLEQGVGRPRHSVPFHMASACRANSACRAALGRQVDDEVLGQLRVFSDVFWPHACASLCQGVSTALLPDYQIHLCMHVFTTMLVSVEHVSAQGVFTVAYLQCNACMSSMLSRLRDPGSLSTTHCTPPPPSLVEKRGSNTCCTYTACKW